MIAWVTGGGTGIGRALAEALYRQGANVLITGRRKDVLEKTAQEIRSRPSRGQVVSMAGDANDPVHISEVMNGLLGHWGAVDLLINNAGTNDSLGAEKATLVAYDEHGKKFTRGASGFLAHIFQHEMDHLEGVLYVDKATEVYEEKPDDER